MTLILGFDDYLSPAKQLAKSMQAEFELIKLHQFPDGETKVTLPINLPKKIIICRTLNQPNNKLIDLIVTASAARSQGVEHITLVAPYLCYMRQDIAFNEGEAVSQRIIGKLLSDYFDSVITVDPHLHRINKLIEAIPTKQAIALHATNAMSNFLQQHFNDPIIIGPDEESAQWVKAIAQPQNWRYSIAEKKRFDDKHVAVSLGKLSSGDDLRSNDLSSIDLSTGDSNTDRSLSINLNNQDVVIVDDIASTGKTLEKTIQQLQQHKPANISVLVTHAFFVDGSLDRLRSLGVTNIWSSDSVIHSSNAFSIIETIAEQLNN
ncbi:phosphoribosylpyrophosphate synthetase [Colwellia sp. 75C3]|uniref:ribose-phosphate diphosphokinase n=1 Tax=Colwellia sp. 75C3 TaxID=888425 RepID=UPI000C344404|nr:ribose-phosphate diphosphokinase [Colwellia sp. 75C3]PKG84219.1 phosphoribosylpyrophosphate synthetase [Colwellia sp. 75C3]